MYRDVRVDLASVDWVGDELKCVQCDGARCVVGRSRSTRSREAAADGSGPWIWEPRSLLGPPANT